jgi:hypothetical protein
MTLHIVQGGVRNGDKRLLERVAGTNARLPTWIAPKATLPGDEIVIFVGGHGFFATARAVSTARPRPDWRHRYGAALASIRLIKPAISLAAIQRLIPELTWANYPRSVTTPPSDIAARVRSIVATRLATGRLDDFSDEPVSALEGVLHETTSYKRSRSRKLRDSALGRSDGVCEACGVQYSALLDGLGIRVLQVHHRKQMAVTDRPKVNKVGDLAVLCANCHMLIHANPEVAMTVATLKRRLAGTREN